MTSSKSYGKGNNVFVLTTIDPTARHSLNIANVFSVGYIALSGYVVIQSNVFYNIQANVSDVLFSNENRIKQNRSKWRGYLALYMIIMFMKS